MDWDTIVAIANTRAIDLWLLFPLGVAVNRLLTRRQVPEGAWADRLARTFGTDDWKRAFYVTSTQNTLLGLEETVTKTADFATIGTFFQNRLREIFAGVAPNPLPLCNSKDVPIYWLFFASSNPRGAKTAVKIAQHILKEP